MNEIWKPVVKYEGKYEVSNFGRVKSLNYMRTGKESILQQGTDGKGHLCVKLCKNGIVKNVFIHTIMYEAFIGIIPEGFMIHHIDEKPYNNTLDNFECISKAEHNKIHKSKPVLQFDLQGNFIQEWRSASEIQLVLNYKQTYISACCLGKYKTAYGYVWKSKTPILN